MSQRVLLVEGADDRTFYAAICREWKIKVLVRTPRDLGASVDSKSNAIDQLDALLPQLTDGAIDRFGVVVDADYAREHGLGSRGTLEKFREHFQRAGYEPAMRIGQGGYSFRHTDGLPSIGVWIMPDNQSDGMLEDFIESVITDKAQVELHQRARLSVQTLPQPLFKSIHRAKADVATWLAWQKMPGASKESTIGGRLVDLQAPPFERLHEWMSAVLG